MTDRCDAYSWGRGFEGQLGLDKTIEIATIPQYIKYFYGKQVIDIDAGAFYSIAITHEQQLYGWGEAKLGQLGTGVQREVKTPTHIPVINEDGKLENVVSVSAGFGHTACITEHGDLYTWGFNVYGQLGLGDMESKWFP